MQMTCIHPANKRLGMSCSDFAASQEDRPEPIESRAHLGSSTTARDGNPSRPSVLSSRKEGDMKGRATVLTLHECLHRVSILFFKCGLSRERDHICHAESTQVICIDV